MTISAHPTRRANAITLLAAGLLLGTPIVVGIGYLVAGALGAVGDSAPVALGRVFTDAAVWRSLLLSLWIACAGTTLALIGALAVTLLLGGDVRLDRLSQRVAALPLPVPAVAAAVSVLLLLSQSGWFSRLATQLHLITAPTEFPALVYDPLALGVIVAVVWKELPFLLLVSLSLQALRGPALLDAARTLGATRWQAVRSVTLPLLLRGLLPSVVAVFVFVLGSLELPMILAPSSPLALPLLIRERRQSLDAVAHGDAFAIALLATGLALIAVVVHESLRDGAE